MPLYCFLGPADTTSKPGGELHLWRLPRTATAAMAPAGMTCPWQFLNAKGDGRRGIGVMYTYTYTHTHKDVYMYTGKLRAC